MSSVCLNDWRQEETFIKQIYLFSAISLTPVDHPINRFNKMLSTRAPSPLIFAALCNLVKNYSGSATTPQSKSRELNRGGHSVNTSQGKKKGKKKKVHTFICQFSFDELCLSSKPLLFLLFFFNAVRNRRA